MATVVASDGVRLNVREGGVPSGPSIVFLHGFSQSLDAWRAQFEGNLATTYRLIAIDLRGHGDSEKPTDEAAYTESARWAGDVDAVLRTYGLVRPILVGWSYGGYVIADYLRAHGTQNVGGIVLVGGATKRGVAAAKPFSDPTLRPMWSAVFSDDPAELDAGLREFIGRCTTQPLCAPHFAATLAANHAVPATVRRALMARALENDDVLAAIDRPVLIIHGTRDAIVLPAAAEHHAAMIPGAELLWYEGVGHSPFIEEAERFDRDLAAFAAAASAEAGTVFP